MVCIGGGVENRLYATANRCLGPDGAALLRAAAEQCFGRSVEQLTYAQIPELLTATERMAAVHAGQGSAYALAAALTLLQAEVDAGLSGRLVGLLTRLMGSTAEPLLRAACAQLGFVPEAVDRARLRDLAEVIHETALSLLGGEMAASLRQSVLEAARLRPAGLTPQIVALAREHLGDEGEGYIQQLCRDHLEIALDDLDAGGVRLVAVAVEKHGPATIGAARAALFVADAAHALVSPAAPLRRRIVELTSDAVGPLAPEFIEEVCARHGLPFDTVDTEHLLWLAEALRVETEPLAGKNAAEGLERELRALRTTTP